jgi:hypothetical protein
VFREERSSSNIDVIAVRMALNKLAWFREIMYIFGGEELASCEEDASIIEIIKTPDRNHARDGILPVVFITDQIE